MSNEELIMGENMKRLRNKMNKICLRNNKFIIKQ